MAKHLHVSKNRSYNRKVWRIYVNGQQVDKVRSCKLGLNGWVEVIQFDEKGICLNAAGTAIRTKRIKNVFVEAVPIKRKKHHAI